MLDATSCFTPTSTTQIKSKQDRFPAWSRSGAEPLAGSGAKPAEIESFLCPFMQTFCQVSVVHDVCICVFVTACRRPPAPIFGQWGSCPFRPCLDPPVFSKTCMTPAESTGSRSLFDGTMKSNSIHSGAVQYYRLRVKIVFLMLPRSQTNKQTKQQTRPNT